MGFFENWLPPLASLSDEQAMCRVQTRGDAAAFAELHRRWHAPVRSLCARMSGDAHLGEDLAQEAFARVFARRATFQPERKFSTWLWRLALNLCHDDHRRRERRPELPLPDATGDEAPELSAEEPSPDEQLLAQERAELVREAVRRLPETHRAVVLLREYEGLKLGEIAAVLGIPEGTVKSRLADSLARLARQLKPLLAAPAEVGGTRRLEPATPPGAVARLGVPAGGAV